MSSLLFPPLGKNLNILPQLSVMKSLSIFFLNTIELSLKHFLICIVCHICSPFNFYSFNPQKVQISFYCHKVCISSLCMHFFSNILMISNEWALLIFGSSSEGVTMAFLFNWLVHGKLVFLKWLLCGTVEVPILFQCK